MFLIVGLGNPDEKYHLTRHNIGFLAIDFFHKTNNFPNFTFSKKHQSVISEKNLNGRKIILAKPQTFMNNSGKAVQSLMKFYQLKPSNLIIIHDDIDIPFSKIRISQKSRSAGHKGVQSVIDSLGTNDFIRIRIGIKPKNKIINTEKFVLQQFKKKEKEKIETIIEKVSKAILTIIEKGLAKAMNEYN